MELPINSYNNLQQAFDYFNKELFNSSLPNCLITLQRKKNSLGYFSPMRFENKADKSQYTHEIALNPSTFENRTDKQILSTLVHEMCHLWQNEQGNAPRRNYHDKEWSTFMQSIGLMPSDTGKPDGKKTGQRMTHYIITDGLFDNTATDFIDSNDTLLFQDRLQDKPKVSKNKNKVKYACTACDNIAWGKSGMHISCLDCDSDFVEITSSL